MLLTVDLQIQKCILTVKSPNGTLWHNQKKTFFIGEVHLEYKRFLRDGKRVIVGLKWASSSCKTTLYTPNTLLPPIATYDHILISWKSIYIPNEPSYPQSWKLHISLPVANNLYPTKYFRQSSGFYATTT